jgi:hypothetical protein
LEVSFMTVGGQQDASGGQHVTGELLAQSWARMAQPMVGEALEATTQLLLAAYREPDHELLMDEYDPRLVGTAYELFALAVPHEGDRPEPGSVWQLLEDEVARRLEVGAVHISHSDDRGSICCVTVTVVEAAAGEGMPSSDVDESVPAGDQVPVTVG